jgi:hypothetical protein
LAAFNQRMKNPSWSVGQRLLAVRTKEPQVVLSIRGHVFDG